MTTSGRSRQTSFVDGSEPIALLPTPRASEVENGQTTVSPSHVKGTRGWNIAAAATDITQGLGHRAWAGCSPPATPASRSATPGSGPARMTPGTSGLRFVDSLPDFRTTDRIGSFSRTFAATSAWGSTVCSLTWTTSATPHGRGLYLLRASARSTAGTGCGLSDAGWMWFTPTAGVTVGGTRDVTLTEGMAQHYQRTGMGNLAEQVAATMWPTPTVQDGKNDAGPSQWERNSDPLNVAVQRVGLMWQTPTTNDTRPVGPVEREAVARWAEGETPATTIQRLRTQVLLPEMWATPRHEGFDAGEHRGTADSLHSQAKRVSSGQKLNPDFVERLMGFPPFWTVLKED